MQGSECSREESTTQEPCPEVYQSQPHQDLLCQLWAELEGLQEKEGDLTTSVTMTQLTSTDCLYSNYSEGADLLCQLYCQVQLYKGSECRPPCPELYRNNTEKDLLCQLWSELEELKETDSDPGSVSQVSPARPVECPHERGPSGALACSLWCEIVTFQDSQCLDCPQAYRNDSESELLCDLWSDLQMTNYELETGDLTPSSPVQNITCKYSKHPTSSSQLCMVWCDLQLGKGQSREFEGKEIMKNFP